MMEDIFGFVTLRPPEDIAPDATNHVDTKDPESTLQKRLIEAAESSNGRSKMIKHANDYLSSAFFVSAMEQLPIPLGGFELAVRKRAPTNLATVKRTVQQTFDQDVAELVASEDYKKSRQRLADSLTATVIAAEEIGNTHDILIGGLRLCGLIERAAASDETLNPKGAVEQALAQDVLLPDTIFPLPPEIAEAGPDLKHIKEAEQEKAKRKKQVEALAAELADLKVTLSELRAVRATDFVTTVARRQPPEADDIGTLTKDIRTSQSRGRVTWALSDEAQRRLSTTTRKVMDRLHLSLNPTPIPKALGVIEKNITEVGAQFYKALLPTKVFHVGTAVLSQTELGHVGTRLDGELISSSTKGAFRAVGVADLEIVKQEIQRYEPSEVAHIENILIGESKGRIHRRSRRVEEEVLVEEETTEESERDLESTNRFELQREVQKTVKDDYNFDTELTIKYGGIVDITSQTRFGFSHAAEETKRSAQTYAQSVTERSVSRIQERVREQRIKTTINEFEEQNIHELNNTAGQEHVVGIYRWVDKIYEAQVYNYGRRLMFEFVVPEPGAFQLYASTVKSSEGTTLDKPETPRDPDSDELLRPSHINISNYQALVAQYAVADVDPPPPAEIVIATTFKSTPGTEAPHREGATEKIKIKDGYQAKHANGNVILAPKKVLDFNNNGSAWEQDDDTYVAVMIGRNCYYWEEGPAFLATMNLGGETVELPIAIQATHRTHWVAEIEILCERTDHELQKWQHEIYDKIIEAFLSLKADYEQQLIATSVGEGIVISGRNPGLNREVEKAELKRGSLTLLTRKTSPHFQFVGSVVELTDSANDYWGYPEINFDEADREAPYIQFLEQAFEWGQMSYTFYPYFWARKEKWAALQKIADADPIYAQFLQAGAARVLVPVRPGYEESLLYYLETQKIWNGANPPSVSSKMYLPMVKEIKEKQGIYTTKGKGTIAVTNDSTTVNGTGTEFTVDDVDRELIIAHSRYRIASVTSDARLELAENYRGKTEADISYSLGAKIVGEPWEVRVPTTLIILHPTEELPNLEKEREAIA